MSEGEVDRDVPAEPGKGVRLQTLIAHAGLASRRAAEKLVMAGKVRVNGKVVAELGARALPDDIVEVDGHTIAAEKRQHYLALNKPPGYLCAMSDEYGRPLAVSLFNPEIVERVYNIGRLDLDSCGLILFTNDGYFASRVGHPSSGLMKEYEVTTDSRIPSDFPQRFMDGIRDGDELLKAKSVQITGVSSCSIWLEEGKNREIRRALATFSLKATVLRRVAIGPIKLANLVEGRWRSLTPVELLALDELPYHASRSD
jgi:23S rRNA pseudouridine2605 synthase